MRIDGNEAIELAIYKEGDANTVATADAIKQAARTDQAQIPPDVELTTIDDQSTFIRTRSAKSSSTR